MGRLRQLAALIFLAQVLLLQAGCVTTTENSLYTKAEVDRQAALDSHVQAARDYLQRGDTDNALRHLRKAVEIDPDAAEVHATTAYAYELTRDFKLADEHYRKALRADPKLSSARNNYGVFLFKQGRIDDARHQFRLAVEDTLYSRRFDAFYNLAMCDLKLGEVDDAQENLERSLTLNRQYAPAMLELAGIYLEQGQAGTAQQLYDNFRTRSRQNAHSLWLGIRIAAANGNRDALASYALALKNLFPESEEYALYQREFGQRE